MMNTSRVLASNLVNHDEQITLTFVGDPVALSVGKSFIVVRWNAQMENYQILKLTKLK